LCESEQEIVQQSLPVTQAKLVLVFSGCDLAAERLISSIREAKGRRHLSGEIFQSCMRGMLRTSVGR
jgi:hypothetical protein